MKLLVYLGHPAQFHFFKNIIKELQAHGTEIKVVIKSKDILEELLISYGLEFENILSEGRADNSISILVALLKRDRRLLRIAKEFRPDLLIGSDPSLAHVGKIIGKPCLTVGEDDYSIIKILAWVMMPFSSCIIAPKVCNIGPWEYKKVPYDGFMKLAYLHPKVFTPSLEKIKDFNKNRYCIIRLAKLVAHHDSNIKGLDFAVLNQVISKLENNFIAVLIDSEYTLPDNLQKYSLKIRKENIHDLMAFAELIISDSQSMSVEAAMLGVPSVRYNDFAGKISVLEELEKRYRLTFGIRPPDSGGLLKKIDDLLSIPDLHDEFKERRNKMLSEKIDVKAFMVWLIENYPQSIKIIRANPDYQFRFK